VQRPMALARRPTDIAALTQRILVKAAALSDHDWVLAGAADVVAEVDQDRLTQAMLQLAANAVTHGAASGVIAIGSAVHSGNRLRFHVRDDGQGVSSEAQKHIFERFRRGSVGRGTAGSGLGLAIVAAIAEAHGGTVAVESSEGTGATFTIDIPIRTPESPS
jgi:two-component system, OmpR family, sensor kinase